MEETIPKEELFNIEINDNDSISTLIKTHQNIQKLKKQVIGYEEQVKNKIKIFLKEKQWKKYIEPESNISISLLEGKTETFDKGQLKLMLTDAQYQQALKTTLYEKLIIITPDDKERLKKYLKKGVGGK
jgi:hypothetical protein